MKSVYKTKKETLTTCLAIGMIAGGVLSASAQLHTNRSADRSGVGQQEQYGQQDSQPSGQRLGAKADAHKSGMQQGSSLNQDQSTARASQLLDKEVHGQDGKKLGDVEEILLNQDRSSVEHIKVSLDDGESVHVSMDEFSVKQGDDSALQVRSSSLELQQRHTQNREQTRIGRDQDNQESRQVSTLLGLDIQGSDGEDVGSINDLIIDTQSGRIESAAIETGGILGMGTRLASVEWQQVTFAADGDTASIRMTEAQLSVGALEQDEYWDRHASKDVKGQLERGLQEPGQRQRTPGASVPNVEGQIQGQDPRSAQN